MKHRCGADRANGNGKCKQPVLAEGARCRYHDYDNMPYAKVCFSRDGPKVSKLGLALLDGEDVAQRTLRVQQNTAHSRVAKDRPGWLYAYYLNGDDSSTYFKVGCTSRRTAEVRVAEWPGAQLRLAVRVPFNELAERMVFTLLDKKRLTRYVFKTTGDDKGIGDSGKRYLTVWLRSKEILKDRAYQLLCNAEDAPPGPFTEHIWKQVREDRKIPAFGTRKTEVEWFKARFSTIELAMREVAAALNAWAKTKTPKLSSGGGRQRK